jgi:hypothetical protein
MDALLEWTRYWNGRVIGVAALLEWTRYGMKRVIELDELQK